MSYKQITKFSELPEIKNGLYVFDIDETLLVFEEVSDVWWKRNFDKFYAETNDAKYATSKMEEWFESIVKNHKAETTDIDGFRAIESKMGFNNNKIVFLTARPISLVGPTYKQISELNLRDPYTIYFSSDKGQKMKWLINKPRCGYESVVFVDDKLHNIEDVLRECPEVQCFQFVPDEYIAKVNKNKK